VLPISYGAKLLIAAPGFSAGALSRRSTPIDPASVGGLLQPLVILYVRCDLRQPGHRLIARGYHEPDRTRVDDNPRHSCQWRECYATAA
jgi:hypothetical protein